MRGEPIMRQNNIQLDNSIQLNIDFLTYEIRPINLLDPTHLKCIVSIHNKKNDREFVDKVDLYHANARRVFIKKLQPRLEVDSSFIDQNLLEIIKKLENLKTQPQVPEIIEIPEPEKKEALAYLRDPNLLDLITADYKACGYVGEELNFLTGYMVATSRKLAKPLGMIIISRSGAGKSTLQRAIVEFMPPEDVLSYTRITNQAFFYKDRFALKHKLISIEEEKGAIGANYAIRNLLNGEGLISTSTIKDPGTGRMKATDQYVEGPSSLLVGTTGTEFDHETLSRFIISTIDESLEQTRRILAKQREQDTLTGFIQNRAKNVILHRHHNIQRLLRPLPVINLHAPHLNFPDDRLIMRRGQLQYSKLIKTITLLHQYQREIKTGQDHLGEFEYIEVSLKDIELAKKIATPVLGRSLDELSPITRQFLSELRNLILANNGNGKQFTRRDVRRFTRWNDYQIRQCLHELENLEYIVRINGYQGKLCTYELFYDGEGDNGDKFILDLVKTPKLSTLEQEICQTLRRKNILCENFANKVNSI